MRLEVSPETLAVLESAGWSERRREDVTDVEQALVNVGFELDPAMLEILASFRGISIPLPARPTMGYHFRNEDPLVVDPLGIGLRNVAEARSLEERLGFKFCPFGWWLCRSHIYLSREGFAVAALPGVVWRLGNSFDEAIDFMIMANAPLDRIESSDGF